ncbi:hypothetical protein V495_00411 [Pseudogymnoascus sp. VKM F-4514 (FW-929)]|nr:hypothetical protein V495_00411 [Pseudogymnoascus sp. VKM F-4514 (FW-929)]KFY67838.1 hypothetical protein V497_00178 [Pseudogymnoascus sp. VKM F-4516 (FW-969)]
MAPALFSQLFPRRDFDTSAPTESFANEWANPSNYAFTILLLLGGDVIARALAQLAGGPVTPVAFSFGWVSYATTAICSAVGENKLMPGADCPCEVINGKNGYVRSNNSFVIGRIVRDYEAWMGAAVHNITQSLIDTSWKYQKDIAEKDCAGSGAEVPRPRQAGLVVSFWEPSQTIEAGKPGHDILHWSGVITTVVQLGIAAIPCGIWGDWSVLLITGGASVLCYGMGSLSQWGVEKWACRRLNKRSKKNFILTRGNGAQHAIAIISGGHGLDLEDLATGFDNLDAPSITLFAQLATIFLGLLWIVLLITSSAITDSAWFLIAVGGLGILQNMFVAGWKRQPQALGVPIEYLDVVGDVKVMNTLLAVERKYEKLGQSMIGSFFPGDLRENEKKLWEDVAVEWAEKKRADGLNMA